MDHKIMTLLEQVQLHANKACDLLSKNYPRLAELAIVDIERLFIQIEMHLEKRTVRGAYKPQGFMRDLA